jgi:hypothetical protein
MAITIDAQRNNDRTMKLINKGEKYIMAELNMWGNKYKEGGHVPKSVKNRTHRLMNALETINERKKVAATLDQSEIDKKIEEYENKDLTSS